MVETLNKCTQLRNLKLMAIQCCMKLNKINILKKEFLKYFLASVIALGVDVICFSYLLRQLNFKWFIAVSTSFIAGAIVAYLLSVYWVFNARRIKDNSLEEFLLFFGIGLLGLGITEVLLYFGIGLLKLNAELVRLISAGITFVFNFAIRKIFLFTGK